MQINNNYNTIFPATYDNDEAAFVEIQQLNASNKPSQKNDLFLTETTKKIALLGLQFLLAISQMKSNVKQHQNVEISLKDLATQIINKKDETKSLDQRLDATLRWMNSFPLARETLLKVVRTVEMTRKTVNHFVQLQKEDANDLRQATAIMTAQPLMQEIKDRIVQDFTAQILNHLYETCLQQNRKAICY